MTPHLRRPTLLVAAVVVCLLPFSSRSASPDDSRTEIDIPMFVGGYGIDFFEETAREFEALRPDIKVKLYGDPRISHKVRIRVIEGTYPNATSATLPWLNLIRAGRVVDLAPYLDGPNWEGDKKWRESFYPGALDPWIEGDNVWAVPFTFGNRGIFYNRKMFREHGWEIPKTWDELYALCDQIKADGEDPFVFPGLVMRYSDMFLHAAHYNLVGPEAFAKHQLIEPGSYSDDRYKRAAGVVQRLSTQYFRAGWEGMDHTASQAQFFQSESAMIVNGSWLVSEMRGKIPDDFELGQFNFPAFADGVGSPAAVHVGSGSFFLFADAENVQETVDFFRFLTSRERAETFSRRRDTPTAVRGVPIDVYSPGMQDVARVLEASDAAYGRPPGTTSTFATVRQAMNDARPQLLKGTMTPEAFGDFMEAAAETERQNQQHPDRVVIRHPVAGTLLLLAMALIIGYTLVSQFRRKAVAVGHDDSAPIRWRWALLFVGPALLMYAVFVLRPSLEAFAWAFTRWDGIGEREGVGVLHFKRLLFQSDVFWKALRNNLFIMVVPTLFVVPLSLFFSFLISRGIWGSKVFRVCFFFPNILGVIAVTLLWMNAYNPSGGLVNAALVGVGLDSFNGFAWLSQEHLYWSLVPMIIWGTCGFNMILYLAAMESVDTSLYEAATIDGAGSWQQFVSITIPMIWEVLVISAVFMVMGGLKAFEQIWLLTNQAPTSNNHVIGTMMVSTMFQDFRIGQATAIAVMLFVLVFFGTLATMRLMKRRV